MTNVLLKLIDMSLSASWIVLAVMALRICLRKGPKWINPILWGIVGLRLVLPFSIESPVSLMPSNSLINSDVVFSKESATQVSKLTINQSSLQGGVNIAAVIWIIGIACILLYALISYLRLSSSIKTAVLLYENIYQSEAVKSPFVCGFVHPRIYLPFAITKKESALVIAHEQAHIRRGDHLTKSFAFLLLAIYWPNPLLWVAFNLFCRDIEFACDEKVIKRLNNEQRADYSETLLTWSLPQKATFACSLFFGEVGVKSRVKNILSYKKPNLRIVILAVISCFILAACSLTDPASTQSTPTAAPISADNVEGTTKYYLTIPEDNVAKVHISTPSASGGCAPGSDGVFNEGESIWLELLDAYEDLHGVSITAYDKEDNVLFNMSLPETTSGSDEETITTWASEGWAIFQGNE